MKTYDEWIQEYLITEAALAALPEMLACGACDDLLPPPASQPSGRSRSHRQTLKPSQRGPGPPGVPRPAPPGGD